MSLRNPRLPEPSDTAGIVGGKRQGDMAALVPGKLYRYRYKWTIMRFVVSVHDVSTNKASGQYATLDRLGIYEPTWYMLHSEWEEVES